MNSEADSAVETKSKAGRAFGWIFQAILIYLLVKTIGFFPSIAGFITYHGLKDKIGVALALLASVLVAGAVFAVAVAYLLP